MGSRPTGCLCNLEIKEKKKKTESSNKYLDAWGWKEKLLNIFYGIIFVTFQPLILVTFQPFNG